MLRVRKKPDDFTGRLTLTPAPGGVAFLLFDKDAEVPTAPAGGGAEPNLGNSNEFAASAGGFRGSFVEGGANPSAALRDTVIRLGIKGIDDAVDRAAITVVRLSRLQIQVPVTPENRLENPESPLLTLSAYLLGVLDSVSNDRIYAAAHVNRLAIALVRVAVAAQDEGLRHNVLAVYLPNLVGLEDGADRRAAKDIFQGFPGEREWAAEELARWKNDPAAARIRQWLRL